MGEQATDKGAAPLSTAEASSEAAFAEARSFIEDGYGYMGLSGVHNARDLGGMPAADGRVIRPGRLVRSGDLARATEGDVAVLRALGVDAVVDLRTEAERKAAPDPEAKFPEASFEFVPVVTGSVIGITHDAGLKELASTALSYERHALERMSGLYASIVTSQAGRDGYRRFFDVVMAVGEKGAGHAVLWHCTAGKDRTGVAAALLETALGVPEDLVVEDYLASNRYTQPLLARELERLGKAGLAPGVGKALKVFYGVNEQCLLGARSAIQKEWGSVGAYLDQELGMGLDRIERLRELYLAEPRDGAVSGS